MTLGKALRAYRARTGVTQYELARKAGISVRTLRDIEHESGGRPQRRSVRKLLDATGLSDAETGAVAVLRIDVLGPLTVHVGEHRVEVGAPMLRRLLGLLTLRANEPVAQSDIVDVLWAENVPSTYRNLIQTYVSRLRRLLGPGGAGTRLLRSGTGYQLVLESTQSDILEFAVRVADAGTLHGTGLLVAAESEYREALSLWRGAVLADLGAEIQQLPVIVALTQRWITVVLSYTDLAFAGGRHQDALPRLRQAAAAEPLHESVNARIIDALAATGQREAAVRLFHEISGRLGELLGVDPGPELRSAYLRCLEPIRPTPGRGGRRPAPEQLPPESPVFLGRDRQLADLDAFLVSALDSHRAARVVVITGSAGVGKTALAIHWAHRVSGRFPDGQLHYDLHGYSNAVPRTAGDALTAFLTGLGVDSDSVPLDVDARAGLLRSLLADREVLLVLDNVTGWEQVLPVLPANARSVVAVTSRNDLSALGLHTDARFVELDVLDEGDAIALLARLSGRRPETPALVELSELCARLPLALKIAAANLAREARGSLEGYVAALRTGNRLAELTVGRTEGVAVQAAFDLSYATLDRDSARLFRLLGLIPSADVSIAALAALAGDTVEGTVQLVERLTENHLVHRRVPDRYQIHDLLRLYADQLCVEVDSEEERSSARRRLADYYLRTAARITEQAYPGMLRFCSLPETGRSAEEGDVAPKDWLAAEHGNLAASVLHTAEQGPQELSWQLTDALRGHLWRNYDVATWSSMAAAALTAAQRAGDKTAEAAMHYSLGAAYRCSGHDPLMARRHLRRAERLFHELDIPAGRAAALDCLGMVLHHAGRSHRAITVLEQSVKLCERTRFAVGQAKALCNLGYVAADLGMTGIAQERLLEALKLSVELDDKHLEALALHNLSRLHHHASRYDDAMDGFRRALSIRTEIGDIEGRAATLRAIGHLSDSAGEATTAQKYWHDALAEFDRIGHPAARDIRSLLRNRGLCSPSRFLCVATI
ncbi:BTAD domain-containing putative transcriptional regulator [Amycolatopsis thailandensis]|uniref:BTAD domain-containing putative transcriptional regulator n=1 Tax=Amycolatopsis thailandensis TaxID=589330 RepID=UPI0036471637